MIYGVIAGILVAVAIFMGGVKTGVAINENTTIKADLTRADKIIVRDKIIIKEVPKIVTKVVTREVEVTKEVERVVAKIPDLLAPDCVLPDRYGMLLVAAANGIDPTAAGGADAFAGEYGCRQTLAAVLADLQAGWRNSARLDGLQEWSRLVTKESPQ